jgi:transcriptional regulator with XRE-family HTH domain
MILRNERRMKLLTQRDLAKKSGVALGTVCRIENGKVLDTNVGTLLKVLDALDIKPSSFFAQYD